MAATIATAIGHDTNKDKRETRLGHKAATGHADTWRTFTECHVNADGSGHVEVRVGSAERRVLHRFDFGPESER